MAHFISVEEYFFWGINFILEIALLWVLRKNAHQKDFPAFTNFVQFSVIQDVALFSASFAPDLNWYFYSYWIGQLITISLLFCVVHEVFESVTHRATWLSRKGRRALVRIATAASVITVAASIPLRSGSQYRVMEAIVAMQRGLGIALFVFMAVIVIFSRTYHVPWYRRDSGIAVGVVAAYGFQMLWPEVTSFLPAAEQRTLYTHLLLVFDSVALIIWIYSFLQAARFGDAVDDTLDAKSRLRVTQGGKWSADYADSTPASSAVCQPWLTQRWHVLTQGVAAQR